MQCTLSISMAGLSLLNHTRRSFYMRYRELLVTAFGVHTMLVHMNGGGLLLFAASPPRLWPGAVDVHSSTCCRRGGHSSPALPAVTAGHCCLPIQW